MVTHRIKVNYLTAAGTLLLSFAASLGISAETTNSIPTDLFLTDDGTVFSYKSPGERVVAISKIADARRDPESRPVDQDPDGHWGKVSDGIQLSLRFEKKVYATGEHITATVLMRNISDESINYLEPLSYWPIPIDISAYRDGRPLAKKRPADVFRTSVREARLFPKTQHRYRVQLDAFYELGSGGEYTFQASYNHPALGKVGNLQIGSQAVGVLVTNTSSATH